MWQNQFDQSGLLNQFDQSGLLRASHEQLMMAFGINSVEATRTLPCPPPVSFQSNENLLLLLEEIQ